MSKQKATIALIAALFVSGCAEQNSAPKFRSYDLALTHPAPYSTYIQVSPGTLAADLPRFRELDSAAFSTYLRESVGCVFDQSRTAHPLGSKRVPAGYMIPIICTSAS